MGCGCLCIMHCVQTRRKPKIAKGARDLLPDQMRIRDVAFGKVKAAFARHGAVQPFPGTLMGSCPVNVEVVRRKGKRVNRLLLSKHRELPVAFSFTAAF